MLTSSIVRFMLSMKRNISVVKKRIKTYLVIARKYISQGKSIKIRALVIHIAVLHASKKYGIGMHIHVVSNYKR